MYYFHFAVTVRPVRPVSPAEPGDLLKHATRCQDVHSRVGNGMASLTTFPHILSLLKMDSQPGIILNISTIILIIILNNNISPLTKLTSNKKMYIFLTGLQMLKTLKSAGVIKSLFGFWTKANTNDIQYI